MSASHSEGWRVFDWLETAVLERAGEAQRPSEWRGRKKEVVLPWEWQRKRKRKRAAEL